MLVAITLRSGLLLAGGCGLADSEAMALLLEYNRRCQPPWTEKELRHKLADARRLAVERLDWAPAAVPPVRQVWRLAKTIQPKPGVAPSARGMNGCEGLGGGIRRGKSGYGW